MAVTKRSVGRVKLEEGKKNSIYKNDQEALRAIGAGALKPKGLILMHVERGDGTGFGKVGATKKALIHFGVKPWLIA